MSFFTDQPAKAKFLEKSNEEGEGEEVDYSSNTFMGFSDDWQHSYPTSQSNEVDALLDTIENRLFAEHEVDNEEEQLFPSTLFKQAFTVRFTATYLGHGSKIARLIHPNSDLSHSCCSTCLF